MPRKRRNRKNRHLKTKQVTNPFIDDNPQNCLSTPTDVMRSCLDYDSPKKPSSEMSPLQLITPLPTFSAEFEVNSSFKDDLVSIKTTPVNYKRSLSKKHRTSNDSFNVTNLNILFDSNFIYNTPKSSGGGCGNRGHAISKSIPNLSLDRYKKQTNSEIDRLHCIGKENLALSVYKASQMPFENHLQTALCRQHHMNTPKVCRQVLLLEKSFDDTTKMLNNKKMLNDNINISNKMNKFSANEVNINPYLNKDVKVTTRDGSFGDISFFSPQLFNLKPTSTPIDRLQKSNIVDYLKDSLIKENSTTNVNDCSFINGNTSGTPKMESDVLNKTPPSVAIERATKSNVSVSKRKSYRVSPKTNRYIKHSRVCTRANYFPHARLSIPRRASVEVTEGSRIVSVCDRVFARLKKYSKMTVRWSARVLEMCSLLGIRLKNSFSSICNINRDQAKASPLNSSNALKACNCDEYRKEIVSLNEKIVELNGELGTVKNQMEEQKTNRQCLTELTETLVKVKEELSQLSVLRTELESLKEQLKCMDPSQMKTVIFAPPALPTPPPMPSALFPLPSPQPSLPPPPPPMPPQALNANVLKIFKKCEKKNVCEGGNVGASRPVISLDDILKVKLKKASNRSVSTPMRRNSQPVVSMDMLRQVKLKPTSRMPTARQQTPDLLPDTAASAILTTSPHSSLSRLLNDNNSVWRLKRLRKVGGYSFDSVYRKCSNGGRRDRDSS